MTKDLTPKEQKELDDFYREVFGHENPGINDQTVFAYEIANFMADNEGILDDDRPDYIEETVAGLLEEVQA